MQMSVFSIFFFLSPRLLTQNTDEILGRCFKLETWEELTVAEGYWGHPKTSGRTVSQDQDATLPSVG